MTKDKDQLPRQKEDRNELPEYLRSAKDNSFKPRVSEKSLSMHSAKLVFSTRLFPEWVAASYGVLRSRYPSLYPSSASELIQLVMQDYIDNALDEIGGHYPTTEQSLQFLVEQGFVNADSNRQFQRMTKVNANLENHHHKMESATSDGEKFKYLRDRDPEKAEELLEDFIERGLKDLEENPIDNEPQETDWEALREASKNEKVWKGHENRLPEDPPKPAKPESKTEPSAEPTPEELQQQAEERDRAEQEKMKQFMAEMKQEPKPTDETGD